MNNNQLAVAACVMAAGQSTRMGKENKLLSEVKGKTLLQHVLHAIQCSNVDEVCVITGHESLQVSDSISEFNVKIVHNKNYTAGLSTSIKLGIENLGEQIDGVLFCLGDMPFVSTTTINTIVAAFKSQGNIVVPSYAGQDGNPRLWPRRFFDNLKNLKGDQGAKYLLNLCPQQVHRIDVDNVGIVLDVDDAVALEFFRSKFNF